MKLGIISDTHDHLKHIRTAVSKFREHQVDLVIHAGDFTSPPAVKALEGLKTAGVFGKQATIVVYDTDTDHVDVIDL